MVLVGFLCEEGDAVVFVAGLYADGLRGDIAVVLDLRSVGSWIVEGRLLETFDRPS